MISPPSRSRDLIFDAVAFKFTMVGRGTNASEQGALKFVLVAFKAHRSAALPTRVGSRERVGSGIKIPLPWQGGRDGIGLAISPPSRSRDLISDAVAFKFTMDGRGTQAREQWGSIKFLPVAFNARRTVALSTLVSCEM